MSKRQSTPTTTAPAIDSAIEELLEQLASQIPFGPDSPAGLRSIRRIKRITLDYLTAVYGSFPFDAMDALLRSLGVQESALAEVDPPPGQVDDLLGEWMSISGASSEAGVAFNAELFAALQTAALDAAAASLADAIGAAVEIGVGDVGVGITGSVSDWARSHAGSLINDLDDTTRKRLGQIVAQGLENQDGVDGIRRSLESFLDNVALTQSRAKTIAMTETANAVSQGAFRANAEVGATQKQWHWFGSDDKVPTCELNDAQGRIPINDAFESGHMFPTAHPRCRCVVVYFGADPAKIAGLAGAA